MKGIILCGGKSTRMGSDKGLLLRNGLTWAEIAGTKFKLLNFDTIVSVSPEQRNTYKLIFPENDLLEDNFPVHGPLKGILTAHRRFPLEDLFVLACDMPDMQVNPMKKLVDSYLLHKERFDFYVYKNREGYEPLCGIYTASGLRKLYLRQQAGALERYSMQYVLKMGSVFSFSISKEEEGCFCNYNEPSPEEKKEGINDAG